MNDTSASVMSYLLIYIKCKVLIFSVNTQDSDLLVYTYRETTVCDLLSGAFCVGIIKKKQ